MIEGQYPQGGGQDMACRDACMTAPDETLCLYHTRIDHRDGQYRIKLPDKEVNLASVTPGNSYRVAVLPPASQPSSSPEDGGQRDRGGKVPPVTEGETVEVEIEDLGDQGDGIARVGQGYVVIVSDADIGERVSVEITEARENMAFAEVVDRNDRIQ